MTNEELLAAWDAGQEITSVEMSGFGAPYEQCIQLLALEMLRAMMADPVDWAILDALPKKVQDETWTTYTDDIEEVPAVRKMLVEMGLTGLQMGAATVIASMFSRHGYEKALTMVPAERHIRVKKEPPERLSPEEAFRRGAEAGERIKRDAS